MDLTIHPGSFLDVYRQERPPRTVEDPAVRGMLAGAVGRVGSIGIEWTAVTSQAAGERDGLRCDQRLADLKLNLSVRVERHVARVALVDLAVVDNHDMTLRRTDL